MVGPLARPQGLGMAQNQRPVMLVKFGSGGRPGTRANKFGAGCAAAIWLGTAAWAGSAAGAGVVSAGEGVFIHA